jgi:glycosyltransferase involved in cell wall biosynthesis
MPDYLSICDILLSPHNVPEGESFVGSPTKLFEYMAAEKIIIASALDQIDEIISPAIDLSKNKDLVLPPEESDFIGIKVEPGNVTQLIDALFFAIENLKDLRVLGRNARIAAIEKHSWTAVTKKILERLRAL